MAPPNALRCPKCGHSNPTGSIRCVLCDSAISGEGVPLTDATITHLDWSRVPSAPSPGPASSQFAAGTVLSGRYEILQLLGQGGMGAVYKARDIELDRLVAVKVIRPELSNDAKTLKRFKQELILARQVTHKNVIRIFDLGSHENVKYITMEFVEGRDLSALLEERRFTPEESARIVRQVCRALEAAHAENVVHRDLKPQNVMVDETGRVRVMDFGLARSVEMSGLTQTGAVLGTPAYMSPEQAKGVPLDARSDLFSLGIILYELLTGRVPFQADSVWASLLARTQTAPQPPAELDPGIPQPLSDITMRCLAIDPAERYQSAAEVAVDLDYWLGDAQPASIVMTPSTLTVAPTPPAAPVSPERGRSKALLGAVAVAAMVVLAAVGYMALGRRAPARKPGTVTVLVADFDNHTGDPIFDGTLEPMVNIALEGASFLNAFNRGEARRAAGKLPNPTNKLDEQSARLIAVSLGIDAVITGSLSRRGADYKLSVEALNVETGSSIGTADVTAPTKDQLLLAIPKLAAPIRKALGDTTPESEQLEASRGTFTAANLEAVHQYGIAMEQQFAGKTEDALQSFSKAAELDPNFARAYAGMAGMSGNLNRLQDAEKYLKLAMEHVDRMTERERYRTRGLYYRRAGNLQKCVEEYSELVRQYPADNIGHQNLANCYSDLRELPKALEEQRRSVEISPKSAVQRRNLALLAAYSGDPQTAEREARKALELNPAYDRAYLPLAYSQILQGDLSGAAETYNQLQKISRLGASYAASGLADLAIYQGRFSEAARLLESGAAADQSSPNLLAAEKLVALASVQMLRGQKKAAVEAAGRAQSSKKANIRFLAARIFAAAGEDANARALGAALAAEPQPEPQADAKLIEGEIALESGSPLPAIKAFSEANQLLDTWIGRLDLGRAYLAAGQFAEADSEFDRCIKRRGEALELADGPTYGYFPPVYYYQGRVREGLKSAGAVESYNNYLNIRGSAGEDPLLPEIRRRAGR